MASHYEIAVIGRQSEHLVQDLTIELSQMLSAFGLELGSDVDWLVYPESFRPDEKKASAVVYTGPQVDPPAALKEILDRAIPVLPVVSALAYVAAEIPDSLKAINCLSIADSSIKRIAASVLECVGLLPKQRRVFISYRRDEARDVALQLFDAISARCFDVFLDTHGVAPAEDFQAMLWHRLCDSDVLLMLDTAGYFNSRWTSAEYGRALAKGIAVLRVGWPGFDASPRVKTASRFDLKAESFDGPFLLTEATVEQICTQLEVVRSQSFAIRHLNLAGSVRSALEMIGGKFEGVGLGRAIYATLPDSRNLTICPAVGVPTSVTLEDAESRGGASQIAVVYDHIGLHPSWQSHLAWLGRQVRGARWMRVTEAAWALADWGPAK